MKTLEVCVASSEDAATAEAGGADRLELNVALELGGITPSAGLLEEVRQTVSLRIIAMVRPRAAGFCYSAREHRQMLRDAETLLAMGADGIACGALRGNRTVDCRFWAELVKLAGSQEVVFHRAFDLVADQVVALEQLVELGTTRILTSGGAPSALEGASQLARLQELAGGRVEILPGSGVSADNVVRLLELTGCDQVHGSFSQAKHDAAGCVAADHYPSTSRARVAAVRSALDSLQE